MFTTKSITKAFAREHFKYVARSGLLIWKPREETPDMTPHQRGGVRCFNKMYAGKPAGSVGRLGYLMTGVKGTLYLNHRLIWAYHHGDPDGELDHADGVRSNNKLANLRVSSRASNSMNKAKPRHNTSGIKGVSVYESDTKGTRYKAQIMANGQYYYLGVFNTLEAAGAARWGAAKALHGAYARA